MTVKNSQCTALLLKMVVQLEASEDQGVRYLNYGTRNKMTAKLQRRTR